MASKTHSHRAAAKAAKPSSDTPTTAPPNAGAGLNNPELYINRELSLLEFQSRVLEEAADATNPLLERVKFLAILGSNLDEFFMVRVSALMKQVATGTAELGLDGRPPSAQLELIREKVRQITKQAHELWRKEIQPCLAEQGISLVDLCCLAEDERAALDAFFQQHVFPVLTPLAFDPGRPFPHISNRSLNLAVVVRDPKGEEHFARVKVPDILPQLVQITATRGDSETASAASKPFKFAWLEQLIAANLGLLFPGMEIVESSPFRVTRDAEVAIQELESDDLLEAIEEAMRERRFLEVVRLEVAQDMPDKILEILTSQIGVNPQDVYRVNETLGMDRFMEFYSLDRPDLKDKPFVPMTPASLGADCQGDLFSLIRQEEFLLHHPYDSFQPVVEFLRQAARDPNVLAIKMTLYRVGRNSPIVAALLDAVEHGKQVAALMELKARFDEVRTTLRPSAKLAEAIDYVRNRWEAFVRYTEDGRIPIDNNVIERLLRPVAIGRKNFLFFGSEKGGQTAATLYTLVQSARRNCVDVWPYLTDVLRRIAAIAPGDTAALETLLPDRWLAAHPEHRLEQREEESREAQARRRRKRAARRIAVAQ